MGRTLALVRHAKADWPAGLPDARRPLAPRGRRDAPAVGRWLGAHLGRIDLAVCSPAVRTRQTWELAAAQLPATPVHEDERVYAAAVADLLDVVRELPDTVHTAVLIGHNPGLEELVVACTGQQCPLRTSTVAVLRWSGPWSELGGEPVQLDDVARPTG